MRTMMAGYASPYWMTLRQANEQNAKIIKESKSSFVVYYRTTERDRNDGESDDGNRRPQNHSLHEVLPRLQCGSD